jgi:sec-independent protein translocase protein TatA
MTFQPQLLVSMPSGGEWLWIALIIVVLFGAKKIPGLMSGIGKGIKEFKDAKEGKDEDKATKPVKEIEDK